MLLAEDGLPLLLERLEALPRTDRDAILRALPLADRQALDRFRALAAAQSDSPFSAALRARIDAVASGGSFGAMTPAACAALRRAAFATVPTERPTTPPRRSLMAALADRLWHRSAG